MSFIKNKSHRNEQDFYLQITSLIDTFVIILVFMLLSIHNGGAPAELIQNLSLPWASSENDYMPSTTLTIKTDGIYIDENKIIDFNQKPDFKKLQNTLTQLARTSESVTKGTDSKFAGKLIIQADQSQSMNIINQTLKTASLSGYHDFKFTVLRK